MNIVQHWKSRVITPGEWVEVGGGGAVGVIGSVCIVQPPPDV